MTTADKLRIKWDAWAEQLWHRAPQLVLGAGALAMLAVAVWFLWPHPQPIPPKEQATLDSLRITKPAHDSVIHAAAKAETIYVRQSRQERGAAIVAARQADSLRRVAIAADAQAQAARDTSSRWYASAQAWHRTADTLAATNVRLANAYSAESTARVAADRQAAERATRETALEDVNARLATDLRRGDCRVLFLRCPTRREAFVAGLVAVPLVRIGVNVASGKATLAGVIR